VLHASFTDSGANGAEPATSQKILALRHPRVEAEGFDGSHQVGVQRTGRNNASLIKNIYNDSYLVFRGIDLTHIEQLEYGIVTNPLHSSGGRIELHLDAPDGTLASTAEIGADIAADSAYFGAQEISADVNPTSGEHDLFFVFKNERGTTPEALFLLDWIEFKIKGPAS
jgi:cytochrome c